MSNDTRRGAENLEFALVLPPLLALRTILRGTAWSIHVKGMAPADRNSGASGKFCTGA